MHFLRRLSIQKKLMFSMGLCLLLFMAISSFLSVRMSSGYVRERVVGQELPAQVGEIRNDVLRQINQPLSVVQTMANGVFLQDWKTQAWPAVACPSSALRQIAPGKEQGRRRRTGVRKRRPAT